MIGKTISQYTITGRIGAGAMGEVYRANDLHLKRPVALKFLSEELTSDERFKRRFMREAQAASALDHPNVCTIYQIGETDDGRLFIAMCYYEGKSLREQLASGPLPVGTAVEYALGIADGLANAHQKGILHRDIKPANIHISREGPVKILDFGLAKLAGRSKVTKTGTSLGTLAYMSPEQVRGEQLDEGSDIFSLGIVLYEMLTGVCPFIADNEAATVYKLLNEDPRPIRDISPGVSERLERIVMHAISKERNNRYQDMGEFRDDLLEILREISPSHVVRFESLRRSGVRRAKRRKRPLAGFVIACTLLAAVILGWPTLRSFFGIGGLGDAKGIVIFPLETATNHASEMEFGTGFMEVLTGGIQELAEFDENLWIVPGERFRKSGINTLDQARQAFGIDAIITGKVTEISSSYLLNLQLLHAGTLRPIGALTVASTSDPGWQHRFYSDLAAMLEVPLDSTQLRAMLSGSTRNTRSFESYVAGLNHLAAENESGYTSAFKAFKAALALDTTFTDALVRCAETIFKMQSTRPDSMLMREAVIACHAALKQDSAEARAYLVRGQIRSYLGDKREALDDFSRAVLLRPRDPDIQRLLGWTYIELGEYDNAESVYLSSCKRNPHYWGGYETLGYLYYILGRYEEAIMQFNQVSELAPNHAPTYNYLGALHYILEEWEEAITLFEKSIALGKNYEACANLGTLYYMKERFEDAVRMHEWAWEYDRSDHLVIGNLAAAYYWLPDKREHAVELFRQAINLAVTDVRQKPDDAVLLSVLAGYYSVIEPDTALYFTERALALDRNNSEVLYRAALVYECLDQSTKALVMLGDAIEKGYPLKEIAHERQLKELRTDPRYDLLITEKTESSDS